MNQFRRVLPILFLLAATAGVSAPSAQETHTPRRRTSAEIIAERRAEAAAREEKRRAWIESGVSAGSLPAPAPARVAEPRAAEPAPLSGAERSPLADPIEAIQEDLRTLAEKKGWQERLDETRIERLAPVIAEEAARYGLPPALVMAVIQLESEYKPDARSYAGATGLMQVMPAWIQTLGPRFGSDLTDEATNVRYGTWVLQDALMDSGGDLRAALLRYNGCRPQSTTGCHAYPDRIRQLVESTPRMTCGGQRWDVCVAEPVRRVFAETD